MEPHAPKGQRTLSDAGCTKWKRSETDGQPRELQIRLDPDIARRVEEHEKQQAAVIAVLQSLQSCPLPHLPGLWIGPGS